MCINCLVYHTRDIQDDSRHTGERSRVRTMRFHSRPIFELLFMKISLVLVWLFTVLHGILETCLILFDEVASLAMLFLPKAIAVLHWIVESIIQT